MYVSSRKFVKKNIGENQNEGSFPFSAALMTFTMIVSVLIAAALIVRIMVIILLIIAVA